MTKETPNGGFYIDGELLDLKRRIRTLELVVSLRSDVGGRYAEAIRKQVELELARDYPTVLRREREECG